MKTQTRHYQSLFVYGTLRREASNELFGLLERYADFIDYARFQGRLYLVDDYPGAVASKNPNDWVQGEVYRLHNPQLVLSRLDNYEECGINFPKPTEYIRDIQYVQLISGESVPVWLYLYNRSTDHLKQILSGDYLQVQQTTSDLLDAELLRFEDINSTLHNSLNQPLRK